MAATTSEVSDRSADELREEMVSALNRYPGITTDEILAAVRDVPRHLFLPQTPLDRAYGLGSVVTHRDERGAATSSASEVTAVAGMLKQLDAHPGHRVLEIGAGTGYNAALLRHLVGPEGSVTTIDIMREAAAEARAHLAAAGVEGVTVVHGDGELGVPANAPYDRIIVTAGADHLPSAWADQLVAGGRLVVPLRINGVTRSVTFEHGGGFWRSLEMDQVGFMPMRGEGQRLEHNLALRGKTGVVVRTDGGDPLSPALAQVLDASPVIVWTGVTAADGRFTDLDFWLAPEPGFARVIMMDGGIAAGLVRPQYYWGSMGVTSTDALAYLTVRPAPAGKPAAEIGVCGYGPGAEALAARLVRRVAAWDSEMNGTGERLWIEVHPEGTELTIPPLIQVHRLDNQIFVGRSHADEYAG